MSNLSLKFKDLGFPSGFAGTFEDFKTACAQYLGASVPSNRLIVGQVGGAKPVSDIGLWLNGDVWYYWSDTKLTYVPADIGIGNKNYSVILFADPSAFRTIHVPDANGTFALLEDVYEPRSTIDLTGTAPVIDWLKSGVFRSHMPGGADVTFSMLNSLPGQEIYIVVINRDSNKVIWPAGINWETITPPVQTVAAATNATFFDGGTSSGTNTIHSITAKFTTADVGKTIKETIASPIAIPNATTITAVAADGTSCTMSANATSTRQGLTFQIVTRSTLPRADLYRFKNVGGTIYGHQLANYSGTIPPATAGGSIIAAPLFNPVAGHYTNNSGTLITTISAGDVQANRIKYTLDGSTPSLSNGTTISTIVNGIISGQVTITGATPGNNITVKAVAIDIFDNLSPVTSGAFYNDYTGAVTVPDPTASVASGTYTTFPTTMPVAITFYSPGTRFRYTTNGTTPSASVGTLVTSNNFTINIPQGTTTLKFIAIDVGTNVSNVITRTYTVTYANIPAPTFSAPGGTYTTFPSTIRIDIVEASPGTKFVYTTNGTTPTLVNGTIINATSGSVFLPQGTTTLKARGLDQFGNISATTTSATYVNTYNAPPPTSVPNPTLSPTSGITPLQVRIVVASPAVKSRYTLDHSNPTATVGALINSTSGFTILISGAKEVRAVAITTDNRVSGIASGYYDPGG